MSKPSHDFLLELDCEHFGMFWDETIPNAVRFYVDTPRFAMTFEDFLHLLDVGEEIKLHNRALHE